ncbi:MAG: hypothetical protein PHE59_05190 [Patescibacteria group bacterium]|nr:hypothetical protein [Patescibacteria group bacterium]
MNDWYVPFFGIGGYVLGVALAILAGYYLARAQGESWNWDKFVPAMALASLVAVLVIGLALSGDTVMSTPMFLLFVVLCIFAGSGVVYWVSKIAGIYNRKKVPDEPDK